MQNKNRDGCIEHKNDPQKSFQDFNATLSKPFGAPLPFREFRSLHKEDETPFFKKRYADDIEHPHIIPVNFDGKFEDSLPQTFSVGMVACDTHKQGAETEKITSCIADACGANIYDIIVAPEYSMVPFTGPLSESDKDRVIDTMKELSQDGTLLIPGTTLWHKNGTLFNTSYVFDQGDVINTYYKNTDGGEKDLAEYHSMIPYFGTSQCFFPWKGMNIGLEICADAGVLAENGVKNLDLLFLMSAGCKNIKKSMPALRENGYGALLDGTLGVYEVHKQTEQDAEVLKSSFPVEPRDS